MAYQKSILLPTLGGTRLKIEQTLRINDDFEKVKSLLGLFKRSEKKPWYRISNLKALSNFNSFDRLCSKTFLPKIKTDESQNIAKVIERNDFLPRFGFMDRIVHKIQSNASPVLVESYYYYSALVAQSFWKKYMYLQFLV